MPSERASIVFLRDYCTRARGADCARCEMACPKGAISFVERKGAEINVDGVSSVVSNIDASPYCVPTDGSGRITIDEESCTRCGICLGICDAFSSTHSSMDELYARFRRIALRGEEVVVTCKENMFPGLEPANNVVALPCLATLSPEFWTLALAENIIVKIACDLTYCLDCSRAGDFAETLYAHAIETAEKWSGKQLPFVKTIPEKESTERMSSLEGLDRRSAFNNLLGDVSDVASGKRRLRNSETLQQFYERRERKRMRASLNLGGGSLPHGIGGANGARSILFPKRRMLLEALLRDPSIASRVDVVVSVTDRSQCDNCLACTTTCPTGARAAHAETYALGEDARLCIGCGLCVDACPHEAIDLVETSAEIFLPKTEETVHD